MRNGDRMRELYAQRRKLREAAQRLRGDTQRLASVRKRQDANGMQIHMMRRRLP